MKVYVKDNDWTRLHKMNITDKIWRSGVDYFILEKVGNKYERVWFNRKRSGLVMTESDWYRDIIERNVNNYEDTGWHKDDWEAFKLYVAL